MRRFTQVLAVISFVCGCGSSSPPAETAPAAEPPRAERDAPAGPPPAVAGVDGQIARAELTPILDAGLGRFLQGVETEPVIEQGRFVGFRLVSFYPDDPRLASVDLRPGDVVTRVNGQPIERPEQALRAWTGLRVASELWIEYRRDGERRELRFEIVD